MRDALADLALGGACVSCGHPGRLLCPGCADRLPVAGVPAGPVPPPAGLAPSFVAGWYADPLRGLILAHKERGAFSLAGPLGGVLAGVAGTAVPHPAGRLVLVPVPSGAAAVRARGHDPVLRMVRVAVRRLQASGRDASVGALLRQRGRVRDQAGLDAAARAANLTGSLVVVPRQHRRLARAGGAVQVLLCDDVITTGATAREGQRALAAVGVPVTAIVALAATRLRSDSRRPLPL